MLSNLHAWNDDVNQPVLLPAEKLTHTTWNRLCHFTILKVIQSVNPFNLYHYVRKCFPELKFIFRSFCLSTNQHPCTYSLLCELSSQRQQQPAKTPLWARSGVEGQTVTKRCFTFWIANYHFIVWPPLVVRPSSSFTAPSNNKRNSPSPIHPISWRLASIVPSFSLSPCEKLQLPWCTCGWQRAGTPPGPPATTPLNKQVHS